MLLNATDFIQCGRDSIECNVGVDIFALEPVARVGAARMSSAYGEGHDGRSRRDGGQEGLIAMSQALKDTR
jgi:hypothetical protein